MSAPKKDEAQYGLKCRACCGRLFRVVYTRKAWGNRIVRCRSCVHCGRRTITHERQAGSGA